MTRFITALLLPQTMDFLKLFFLSILYFDCCLDVESVNRYNNNKKMLLKRIVNCVSHLK